MKKEIEERMFHICFYPEKSIDLTIGVNFIASTMEGALSLFRELHPKVEIVYIHNKSL
jgi:hypothetical protein